MKGGIANSHLLTGLLLAFTNVEILVIMVRMKSLILISSG